MNNNEMVKVIIGDRTYYKKKDILEEIKETTGREMSKKEINEKLKPYCTTISGFGRTLFIEERDVSSLTFPCEDGSFRLIKRTKTIDYNKTYEEKLSASKFALGMVALTLQNKLSEEQLEAYVEKKEKEMLIEAKEETERKFDNFEKNNEKDKEQRYQEVIDGLNNSFKEYGLGYKAFALEGYDKNSNDLFYMGAIIDKEGKIIETVSEYSELFVYYDEQKQQYILYDYMKERILTDTGEPKVIDDKYISELVEAINTGKYTIEDIINNDISISIKTKYGEIWSDGAYFGNTVGKILT